MSTDNHVNVDLDDLTVAEVETLEEILDAPIDSVFGDGVRKGPVLRALAYIGAKRENPAVTMEEVSNYKVSLGASDPS